MTLVNPDDDDDECPSCLGNGYYHPWIMIEGGIIPNIDVKKTCELCEGSGKWRKNQ